MCMGVFICGFMCVLYAEAGEGQKTPFSLGL